MIYVVIDTNVFVSAYLTHNYNSSTSKIVDSLFKGKIIPLYNEEIMTEYQEVLSRPHFDISKDERDALFEYIRTKGVEAERTSVNIIFVDESDRVFYEIALSKEDSFLVTGNLKHYPQEPIVVTPAQMLQIIEDQQ